MKALSLSITFILTSLFAYSQFSYDLSLKTSSFAQDRLQLEQRFHLKSDYFLLANFNTGRDLDVFTLLEETSGDEITNQRNFNTKQRFYSGRIGIGKQLTFLPTDFFYCAMSVGVGYEEWLNTSNHFYMYYDENGSNLQLETGLPTTVESTFNKTFKSGAFYQLYGTLGMDVPVTERFSINCELNLSLLYHEAFNSISYPLNVSGGIRYSFGKVTP